MTRASSKTAKLELSCRRKLYFWYFWRNKPTKQCRFATAVFWGCLMRKRCFLLQFNLIFWGFQSTLGWLEGTGRLPRTPWSQAGNIELQGYDPGVPWDPSWRAKQKQKTMKKTGFSQFHQKKKKSLQTSEHLQNKAGMLVKLQILIFSLLKKYDQRNFENSSNRALVQARALVSIFRRKWKNEKMHVCDCSFSRMPHAKSMFLVTWRFPCTPRGRILKSPFWKDVSCEINENQ